MINQWGGGRETVARSPKYQPKRTKTWTKLQSDRNGLYYKGSTKSKPMTKAIYKVPSRVLLGLGIYDLVRGFMHTFLLKWSGTNIAGFNHESTPIDQFFMLGTFGISNFLTGFIYLLISRRSPELSPYVLALIPASYLLGLIGIWSNGIHGTSAYGGKYILYIYFAICIATLVNYAFDKRKWRWKAAHQRKNLKNKKEGILQFKKQAGNAWKNDMRFYGSISQIKLSQDLTEADKIQWFRVQFRSLKRADLDARSSLRLHNKTQHQFLQRDLLMTCPPLLLQFPWELVG